MMDLVAPGDRLDNTAETHNSIVATVRAMRAKQSSRMTGTRDVRGADNIVLVRNESGATCPRFGVLVPTGVVPLPSDNLSAFVARPCLIGDTPDEEHAGRFVIAAEPIRDGAIGRAYVAGACVAKVKMTDESHTCADVSSGHAEYLASAASGVATLLWVQAPADRETVGVALSLIRIGGAWAALPFYQVANATGDAGDYDEAPTYVYDLYALDADIETDDPIATGVPVLHRPTDAGRYKAAADGTLAIARYNATTDAWEILLCCDECLQMYYCSDE